MTTATQHPVTPKDQQAFDDGRKNGHLDHIMGYRSMIAWTASYSLNRYSLYYGAGYRRGWME